MQPLVIGRIHPELANSAGHGRYLSIETLYLYSLLWDPFILTRTQAIPAIRLGGEGIDTPGGTLLFHAHSSGPADMSTVRDVLQAGGHAILNNPDEAFFEGLPQLAKVKSGPSLISLRERWDLGIENGRSHYYADRAPFLLLDGTAGRVLSHIGENPDLMVVEDMALFAGNPFACLLIYRNASFFGELLLDISTLLTRLVASFTSPLTADEERDLPANRELRRDFHAFGYAYLTVQELDRCYAANAIDLTDAAQLAKSAAGQVINGQVSCAAALLGEAFKELEKQNRKLQPVPAVFTDTLHGGGLFDDLGYFEFDWPQHPADVLKEYLHWSKTRSYRFNIDFAALSLKNMAIRFPTLFAELKAAHAAGLLEFVNGSMNQPYPPFHSLESQIRQFDGGNAVFEKVLGSPARTYASQEFGFCPQMASVLSGQGYEQVVLRVQNMGDAPTVEEDRILWTSPDGDNIRALPSHPYKSEQLNEVTYNNLHLKLFAHGNTGKEAIFTGLGDVTYYRPFREELARICHYAPVFGRFETWSGYFDGNDPQEVSSYSFSMEDFDCRAAFLEISKWPGYQTVTGNYNTNCIRSQAASNLFAAAEFLDSIAAASGSGSDNSRNEDNWNALTIYQGHDTYIVPFHNVGVFMGNGGSHAGAVVNDYCGPWDAELIVDKSTRALDEAESRASKIVQDRLRILIPASPECNRYAVYNFGPARTRVALVEQAAGKALIANGERAETQDAGDDLLVLVDPPANGYLVFEESHEGSQSRPPAPRFSPVCVGANWLENAALKAEFDLEQGTLKRLIRKADEADILAAGSHSFYLSGALTQRCTSARILASGPLRACIEFEIELVQGGVCCGRLLSWVSLDADQVLLRFEETILECPEIRGDQWSNHLGVRFTLAATESTWMRSHFNMLEESHLERIFSPNLVLAKSDSGHVLFVNHGNEFYLRDKSTLSNILIFENEPARKFKYAIGLGQDNAIMQARSCVQPGFIQSIAREAGRTDDKCALAASFFATDSTDVETLSCRYEEGRLLIRLANTTSLEIQTKLHSFRPFKEAWLTDLSGQNTEQLETSGTNALLTLRPWDIRQVALTPTEA